uniref:Secreted protein n=1 Tax=Dromaius novaehollandiae TaxID=8790 RepID=A0A8C4JU84_DRONO
MPPWVASLPSINLHLLDLLATSTVFDTEWHHPKQPATGWCLKKIKQNQEPVGGLPDHPMPDHPMHPCHGAQP